MSNKYLYFLAIILFTVNEIVYFFVEIFNFSLSVWTIYVLKEYYYSYYFFFLRSFCSTYYKTLHNTIHTIIYYFGN